MGLEYFYSDIDNTLNNKKAEGQEALDQEIQNTLRELRLKKIGFGVATTRGFLRSQDVVGDFVTMPYIILNGGEVYDVNGLPLFSFPLSLKEKVLLGDWLISLKEEIDLLAFYPNMTKYGRVYTPSDDLSSHIYEIYPHTFESHNHVTSDLKQFLCWLQQKECCMVEIQIKGERRINHSTKGLNVSYDGIYYVNTANVNKGSTLKLLCDSHGIDTKKLLLAGDSDTDISLLNINPSQAISVGRELSQTAYSCKKAAELAVIVTRLIGKSTTSHE